MSEQLLTILKICLLVLLYLFFVRVLRSVWVEINGPRPAKRQPVPVPAGATAGPSAGGAVATASKPATGRKARHSPPTHLTVIEPPAQKGRTYSLGDELTVGRAPGCQIMVDDTYASQLHARVFTRDGQLLVEDLGSTNGTFLGDAKVAGPTAMHRGDHLRVGNTVMEVT
jgi:pSer/pThr/pTyr-binding forkhead associated (FHA) protein